MFDVHDDPNYRRTSDQIKFYLILGFAIFLLTIGLFG